MTHENDNDWLMVEIATGLQKLACLSLDRTPASELMAGTAHAWLEAITAENAFTQERDAPRIRAAFKSLASRRESWPAPRHFMDALPRVETRALGYEVKPASKAEAAAAMAKIAAMLKRRDPEATMPEHDADKAPLADVERDLRDHYDRKAAAAGPDA